MRTIDELGDGLGAGLRVRLYFWTRRAEAPFFFHGPRDISLRHHATTINININGESYRLKEKRRAGLLTRAQEREEKEVNVQAETNTVDRQSGNMYSWTQRDE